jgi:uncharacterized protein YaiI (UPF0178 family)
VTVPFTARLAVELAVEDVERTAAALRPRGAPFTEREYDLLIESRVREAMKGRGALLRRVGHEGRTP